MKNIVFIILSFLVFSVYGNTQPKEVVEKIFNIASKTELAKDPTLQTEIEGYVDFDKMALSTLGSSINSVPKEELTWYKKSLKEIITKTVYPKAYDFLNKVSIKYQTPIVRKDKASINSIVKNKAQVTDVTYYFENKNGWKIVDIALDDESWVDGIQRDVVATIKKDGYAGLKSKLVKRLDELKKSN